MNGGKCEPSVSACSLVLFSIANYFSLYIVSRCGSSHHVIWKGKAQSGSVEFSRWLAVLGRGNNNANTLWKERKQSARMQNGLMHQKAKLFWCCWLLQQHHHHHQQNKVFWKFHSKNHLHKCNKMHTIPRILIVAFSITMFFFQFCIFLASI